MQGGVRRARLAVLRVIAGLYSEEFLFRRWNLRLVQWFCVQYMQSNDPTNTFKHFRGQDPMLPSSQPKCRSQYCHAD